jgi:serine/threonine-protein kinase
VSDDLPEHEREIQRLDEYLRGLQAGERPDRDKLLRDHPRLAPLLDCLDALDGIASDLLDGVPRPKEGETPKLLDPTVTLSSSLSSSVIQTPGDFGSYELLEEIGRGGMGVVYKARQKGLERTVAVKMILAGHLASPEHVRRFRAEAKAAAVLRHSNIVHIHEVGQLQGRHYFAMEYVDGTSLAERIRRGRMDVHTAVRLVAQVARAVDHLHRQGIVHRDLKPSNILLDADDKPYVTDFGLAKVFAGGTEATTTGAILGTASYMAPEQASGHSGEATSASDVYSLGAILYELLTGQPPFRHENPMETLIQVLTREPVLPRQLNRDVPRSLEVICLKCLSKSPDDRYPSAAGLADDLEHFLKGETLAARPPNLLQRTLMWGRREPALAARLAVLGLFLVVHLLNNAYGEFYGDPLPPGFFESMLIILGVWAATAVGFQQLLKSPRWSLPACFVWGILDSALLFTVLFLANGVASPLIVVYALLIVASGLWFRVRFVWFMCGLSLASYGAHVLDFYLRRAWDPNDLGQVLDLRWDRHVIFAVALLGISGGVAYLVHRVRVLSSYYGQKP